LHQQLKSDIMENYLNDELWDIAETYDKEVVWEFVRIGIDNMAEEMLTKPIEGAVDDSWCEVTFYFGIYRVVFGRYSGSGEGAENLGASVYAAGLKREVEFKPKDVMRIIQQNPELHHFCEKYLYQPINPAIWDMLVDIWRGETDIQAREWEGWWIGPKGEVYHFNTNHQDWMMSHKDIVSKYLSEDDMLKLSSHGYRDVMPKFINQGWTRIRQSHSEVDVEYSDACDFKATEKFLGQQYLDGDLVLLFNTNHPTDNFNKYTVGQYREGR
jgi:hypothetical protein